MPDESTALTPIQEKQVEFYGDQVLAVLVEIDGQEQVYVPLRPICEYLGLDWAAQTRRLRRDDILSEEIASVAVTATEAGGKRGMLCLPLRVLPGWLFGIETSRIRTELQPKVKRYRRECFEVLWRAFAGEIRSRPPHTALTQVAAMGRAITALAEQQIELENRVATHDVRLDRAAEIVRNLTGRVSTLERRIAGGEFVSETQAAEIANRVKALAEWLTSKEPNKVHYQTIYSELYRRWGVSSYKTIPMAEYESVLQFLEDWRQAAG